MRIFTQGPVFPLYLSFYLSLIHSIFLYLVFSFLLLPPLISFFVPLIFSLFFKSLYFLHLWLFLYLFSILTYSSPLFLFLSFPYYRLSLFSVRNPSFLSSPFFSPFSMTFLPSHLLPYLYSSFPFLFALTSSSIAFHSAPSPLFLFLHCLFSFQFTCFPPSFIALSSSILILNP